MAECNRGEGLPPPRLLFGLACVSAFLRRGCNGGARATSEDFLTPLMQWVEDGTAPDPVNINYHATNANTAPIAMTRPVCPIPRLLRIPEPAQLAEKHCTAAVPFMPLPLSSACSRG